MYAVQLICTYVFFLYNVHIKECTFDIFDKPIQQVLQKKELTNVEIQEQTASFSFSSITRPHFRISNFEFKLSTRFLGSSRLSLDPFVKIATLSL